MPSKRPPRVVKLLTPHAIQVYRRDFDRYDTNNNGVLDDAEVEQLLTEQLGGSKPTAREMSGFMKQIDKDGNGKIEFGEYLSWVMNCEWKQSIFDYSLQGEWHPVAEQYWGYMKVSALSPPLCTEPTLTLPPFFNWRP